MKTKQMKTNRKSYLALFPVTLGLAVALSSTTASAAALLSSNFDTNLDGWTIVGSTSPVVATAAQSPSPATPGGKGVSMNDDANDNTHPKISTTIDIGADPTKILYVQYDYYSNGSFNANFQLQEGTGPAPLNVMMSNGFLQVNQGEAKTGFNKTDEHELALANDTWYRFTYTVGPVNTTTDTFSVRVQTLESSALDKTVSNLGFQNNLDDIKIVDFRFNKGDTNDDLGEFYIDNVLVTHDIGDLKFPTIPEPSVAVLLGLGVAGLACRRRRLPHETLSRKMK